jgi:hypothetical protein
MIVSVLVSRSVLLNAAAVGMLIGISILRFVVADPGVMLLAVVPIALLGVMYGVRGGLFGASVASGVLLAWAFTQGHPGAVEEIDEPAVFFLLGLLSGMYAHGALGDSGGWSTSAAGRSSRGPLGATAPAPAARASATWAQGPGGGGLLQLGKPLGPRPECRSSLVSARAIRGHRCM